MNVYDAVIGKRDTRAFAAREVPEPILERILHAGRMAGSARALEPVRVVVVRDPAQRARLAACGQATAHLLTAPVVAAIVLVPEFGKVGAPFTLFRGPFDAGRAGQNMMLAALESGIASCPASMHDNAAAARVLGLPEGHYVANVIAFGYPQGTDPVAGTRPRVPFGEYVHWETW
ncbi:MAG: nitroreductase family protein [Thermomicrobiales bacterium]|nr:nitroreductase family protein [Thermomicrobiales bacterium]